MPFKSGDSLICRYCGQIKDKISNEEAADKIVRLLVAQLDALESQQKVWKKANPMEPYNQAIAEEMQKVSRALTQANREARASAKVAGERKKAVTFEVQINNMIEWMSKKPVEIIRDFILRLLANLRIQDQYAILRQFREQLDRQRPNSKLRAPNEN